MTPGDILIVAIPLVLAITFHEAAHGFMAYLCGDPTAQRRGRMTLNPIRHIDFVGTIIIPAVLVLLKAPFLFGYAKPVPINPKQFFHYRSNLILVATAGPAMNIGLVMVSWALYLFVHPHPPYLVQALLYSIHINLVLAVFNMLPLLPLDGGRVLSAVLPSPFDRKFLKLERFGFLMLLLLLTLPTLTESLGGRINPLGWFIHTGVEGLKHMLGVTY